MYINCKILLIFFYITTLLGCATTGPKTFSIDEKTLQSKLASHLNKPISLMKVMQVQLSNPTIKMDEKTNRLNAIIDTQFTSPWISSPLMGKMHLSGVLGYAATEQAVKLDDAIVERFDISGLDDAQNASISALAKQVGGELLTGLVLYQVKPEELRFGKTDYAPQDFKIIGNKLQITLMPNVTKE